MAIGLIVVALYAIRHTVSSTTLLVFAVVVPSIILHEVAHGVTALAFGDDTAQRAGRHHPQPDPPRRPLGHPRPARAAGPAPAWACSATPSRCPINPARMRHPRNDRLFVSLAGPATNLALAGLSILLLRALRPPARPAGRLRGVQFRLGVRVDLTDRVLYLLGFVNVTLAVFNALPIPPLDGSAVVARLLPRSAMPAWYTFQRYAMPVLLVLVLLNPGIS